MKHHNCHAAYTLEKSVYLYETRRNRHCEDDSAQTGTQEMRSNIPKTDHRDMRPPVEVKQPPTHFQGENPPPPPPREEEADSPTCTRILSWESSKLCFHIGTEFESLLPEAGGGGVVTCQRDISLQGGVWKA